MTSFPTEGQRTDDGGDPGGPAGAAAEAAARLARGGSLGPAAAT
jgi:hypothetical protein